MTDKAVSKWERGVGFPDIKLIEPLSEALGVSILEIMQSEKAVTPDVSKENASDAIANVIDVVEYQRKIVCFSGILGMIVQGLLVVYELARLPQNGIVLFGGIVAYVVALLICCCK